MRDIRAFVTIGALAACGVLSTGCKAIGLSAPQSDDGGKGGTANSVPSVSYQISNPNPKVGDQVFVTVAVNNQPVANNTGSLVTSSDQGVLFGTTGFRAVSVGKSTLTITYGSYSQSQVVNVSPSSDGMQAYIYLQGNVVSSPAFGPPSVTVKAGSMLEFKLPDLTHNITFDGTPGAPADVAVNTVSSPVMTFATPGVYAFQCTLHGETGVVTVVP